MGLDLDLGAWAGRTVPILPKALHLKRAKCEAGEAGGVMRVREAGY